MVGRHRKAFLLAAVLVAAPTAAFVAARLTSDSGERQPSLSELAAKNYRTLSVAESRRLLRYAEREYRCIVAQGQTIAAPVASRTRIRMAAPGRSADELIRWMTACDPEVGGPPPGSSLQARDGQVLVYVPKRCLLDPSEVDSAT